MKAFEELIELICNLDGYDCVVFAFITPLFGSEKMNYSKKLNYFLTLINDIF